MYKYEQKNAHPVLLVKGKVELNCPPTYTYIIAKIY